MFNRAGFETAPAGNATTTIGHVFAPPSKGNYSGDMYGQSEPTPGAENRGAQGKPVSRDTGIGVKLLQRNTKITDGSALVGALLGPGRFLPGHPFGDLDQVMVARQSRSRVPPCRGAKQRQHKYQ